MRPAPSLGFPNLHWSTLSVFVYDGDIYVKPDLPASRPVDIPRRTSKTFSLEP